MVIEYTAQLGAEEVSALERECKHSTGNFEPQITGYTETHGNENWKPSDNCCLFKSASEISQKFHASTLHWKDTHTCLGSS